ncbi:MAG: hypothetical protein H6917_03890 [Novosphingobium sp.]|nr:hypothetical protein [Novosphingobium sp.]MCP5401514.1 hypothetical protein [Novosphingobium sp.]
MTKTDVPLCFRRARQEMLMALGASSAEDADEHRKLADEYITEAVHDLQCEPEREHDWSRLAQSDPEPA